VIAFVEFGVVDLPTKADSIQSRITDITANIKYGGINHPDIDKMTLDLRLMMVNHVIAVRPAAVRPFVQLVVFCADNVDRRWIDKYTRLNGSIRLKQDLETWIAGWLHANGGIKVTINCASVREGQIEALSEYPGVVPLSLVDSANNLSFLIRTTHLTSSPYIDALVFVTLLFMRSIFVVEFLCVFYKMPCRL
jgi:hypothetical protein